MIQYGDYISAEEYMELRKMVGWVEFPLEEAQACIDNAYLVRCVRDEEKAIGVVRLLWDGRMSLLIRSIRVKVSDGRLWNTVFPACVKI